MSRNGWIACLIGVIVLLCVGTLIVTMSVVGVIGVVRISPTLANYFLFEPVQPGTPTQAPVVIRPTPRVTLSIPTDTPPPVLTPIPPATQIPEASPTPVTEITDTLHTLENTLIPINDPIDLAVRLLGMHDIPPTSAHPARFYTVGAQQSFWIGNGYDENFRVDATLRFVTDHAYFWIEDNVRYSERDLQALAGAFENQIYPTNHSIFGSEWTPGVDADPHIYILYARGIGDENAGYFSSADEYPVQINHFSNGHELFVVNADNSPLDDSYTFGVLAHEFQHMIHWNLDRNESGWLNEGFSQLATLLNGYDTGGFDGLYTSQPDLQLNDWPDESQEDTTPHYGASYLFLTYFLDRFGKSATQALVANQDNDLDSIDSTLRQIDARDPITGKPITADSFFLDWAVTNYLLNPNVADGRYAYKSYSGPPRAPVTETVYSCPIDTITRDVHQYGVDYIRFNCSGSYTIHFEGSVQTTLLPQDPHSGRYTIWSNKSDESDTTLTRSFDLTNVSGPLSFSYWTWFDIENGWDYVYLEASTNGKDWQILNTPSGTSSDPQGNSYGWGYTGSSGDRSVPIWIKETVDLSRFAGQNLTLRFEYVTDSNVTGEGFLLDDLSIPEIGYSTDFEVDDGGWQAAGWARIQNVLPQTYQLALISTGDITTVQNITLNPDITADIPFTIDDRVHNVILVVGGTARFTRQLAPYRFNVTNP